MSAAVAVIDNFGSYEGKAQMYGSLSAAAEVASLVKSRAQVIRLALKLRILNVRLDGLFAEVHALLDGKDRPASDSGPLTEEQRKNGIAHIRELGTVLSVVYDNARRKRLTNNSLIAGPLNRILAHAEELVDLADWLEMVLYSGSEVDAVFARARAEKDRGEVFDLIAEK